MDLDLQLIHLLFTEAAVKKTFLRKGNVEKGAFVVQIAVSILWEGH